MGVTELDEDKWLESPWSRKRYVSVCLVRLCVLALHDAPPPRYLHVLSLPLVYTRRITRTLEWKVWTSQVFHQMFINTHTDVFVLWCLLQRCFRKFINKRSRILAILRHPYRSLDKALIAWSGLILPEGLSTSAKILPELGFCYLPFYVPILLCVFRGLPTIADGPNWGRSEKL